MTRSVFTAKYKHMLELLVEARTKAGLSQVELAKRLGRRQSFVSKYELGERRIDIIEFLEIAKGLGIDACETIKQLERENAK